MGFLTPIGVFYHELGVIGWFQHAAKAGTPFLQGLTYLRAAAPQRHIARPWETFRNHRWPCLVPRIQSVCIWVWLRAWKFLKHQHAPGATGQTNSISRGSFNGSNFGPGSSHFWGWTESLSSTPSLPQRGWPAPVVLWAPHPHWVHILWPKSVDLTMILSLTPPPWMCSRGRATSLGNKCIYFSIMLLPRERVTFFISSETLMPTCTIFWCDYGQGPMLDWDLSLTYWWTLEGKDFK